MITNNEENYNLLKSMWITEWNFTSCPVATNFNL